MFEREELHPQVDVLRHAELLAGVHNGPRTRNARKILAHTAFLKPDPWATAPTKKKQPPTAAELAAQIAAMNAARHRR